MLPMEYDRRLEIAKFAAATIALRVTAVEEVILFGSTAKKKLTADDIDILIKTKNPVSEYTPDKLNDLMLDTARKLREAGIIVGEENSQIHFVYMFPDQEQENQRFLDNFGIKKTGVHIYP